MVLYTGLHGMLLMELVLSMEYLTEKGSRPKYFTEFLRLKGIDPFLYVSFYNKGNTYKLRMYSKTHYVIYDGTIKVAYCSTMSSVWRVLKNKVKL